MQAHDTLRRPFITTVWESLGWNYAILLPLVALVSFVIVIVVPIKGKGPMSAVAVLLITHAPLMVGLFAALTGMIDSFKVIGSSPQPPTSSTLAVAVGSPLMALMVALALMAPTYVLAMLWAFIRALLTPGEPATAK